jgi:hypothetical protein
VAFQKCLLARVQSLHQMTQGQGIAIDGKVARKAILTGGRLIPRIAVGGWRRSALDGSAPAISWRHT